MTTLPRDISVEHHEIDGEHRRMIDLLNDLIDTAATGKRTDALLHRLDDLFELELFHLNNEIHVLRAAGYPDVAEHEAEHAIVRKILIAAHAKASHGESIHAILSEVNEVIIRHIHEHDAKIREYFAQARGT